MLSPEELKRYNRHLILESFGIAGQQKLKKARVLVIGAGGLSAPLLYYLAAAGVGTIGIVDGDWVEESNLQRQILFSMQDVGKLKVDAAKEQLLALNPYICINTYPFRLTAGNAPDLIAGYDAVADGSDNFPTRYLVNDCCVRSGKPLVYGSITRFEGQVGVFNLAQGEVFSPNYRDLYPEPPAPGTVPDCSEAGVLGVLPGIVGSLQASEVLKIISGVGEPLAGKLLLFNALSCDTRILEFEADPANPLNKKEVEISDYQEFCNFEQPTRPRIMKEITVSELKQKMDSREDFQLIDVREPHEYEIASLGGELIPLGSILDSTDRISRDRTVVIHCRSGARSATAVLELEKRFGFTNLYNLKGGILAYSREIDASIPSY
jgi:sulfur-carrier protein adenylyltransferase/sulfurtransferase